MSETEKRRLGASQLEVSALGTGTWAWGDKGVWGYGSQYGLAECQQAYTASLDAGIDFYDTAEIYGNGTSEQLLGTFFRQDGRRIIIASKFAPLPYRFSATALPDALEASLNRLGVPKIDLYQIHWPYTLISINALMEAMALACKSGKIGAIGVSNFNVAQMQKAQARLARYDLRLASNQVHYSLLHRKPEANGVLNACRQMDVALIAYSPLEQGLLTGKFGPDYKVKGSRGFSSKFRKSNLQKIQPLIDVLKQVGEAHDKTPAQVSLNWLLKRDPLVIPIPGAKNARQAEQNAEAMNWTMTETEFELIDRVSRGSMG